MGRPRKPITAENEEQAALTTKKRKCGLKSASLEGHVTASPNEVSEIVRSALIASKQPKVKDDEECGRRIEEYFANCSERGALPLWEELALYLGTTRKTLYEWNMGRGCSSTRCDMIKKAKEICASVDAKLAQKGQIQPVVYIFRAKNFFDMRDQSEVVLTPNNPLGEQADQKALEAKLADIVIDADQK